MNNINWEEVHDLVFQVFYKGVGEAGKLGSTERIEDPFTGGAIIYYKDIDGKVFGKYQFHGLIGKESHMINVDYDFPKAEPVVVKEKFAWNQKENSIVNFWDTELNIAKATPECRSLKERLANPNGVRVEDGLSNISKGLALIMNELEKMR